VHERQPGLPAGAEIPAEAEVYPGEDAVERVKAEVAKLTEKYPLYPED